MSTSLTSPSSSHDQRTLRQSADKLTLSLTDHNQENSSSALPLDTQSNSSVETMNDMRSCIPGPSSTILSVPSECHGVTSCDTVPDSATIEITPTALTSVTSSQTSDRNVENTTSVSGSSHDEKCSTSYSQESSTQLLLEAQSNSSVVDYQSGSQVLADAIGESSTNVEGSCVVTTIMETLDVIQLSQSATSCDAVPDSVTIEVTPLTLTSLTSVGTSDVNVENTASVSGSSRDEKYSTSYSQESSTLLLDAQSSSSVETIPSVPLECHGVTSCDTVPDRATIIITPTAELTSTTGSQPSDMNFENTTSVSGCSLDEKCSPSYNQESSTLPLDAQSNSSSVVDCQTGSQVLDDAICESSTNVEGSCVATTVTETLDVMPPSDTSPPSGSYACQTISSAPTCVSGSAATRPLISVEVTPPSIPSLMSIQTTPPPWWCDDYAFGPRFPTPYSYPTGRDIGASQPRRNTSPTNGGAPVRQPTPLKDIQTTPPAPIPALMSIQTSTPAPYNDIRPSRNNGVPAPSAIPPLMSIQTRPPWVITPPRAGPRPPRGTRRRSGTRRPQGRGQYRFTS